MRGFVTSSGAGWDSVQDFSASSLGQHREIGAEGSGRTWGTKRGATFLKEDRQGGWFRQLVSLRKWLLKDQALDFLRSSWKVGVLRTAEALVGLRGCCMDGSVGVCSDSN